MWQRSEIENIAEDFADASASDAGSASEDQMVELKGLIDQQQREIDAQGRVIEIQSRQIDLLNDHASKEEERLRGLIDHYNRHTH